MKLDLSVRETSCSAGGVDRSVRRPIRSLGAGFVVVMLSGVVALADQADPRSSTEPAAGAGLRAAQTSVVVRTILRQTPAELTTHLRLTASRDTELELLAGDLVLEGDERHVIPRGQIELVPAGPELRAGREADVALRIRGVDRPGVWTGNLVLRPKAGGLTDRLELPIRLELGATPKVATVHAERTLRIVSCEYKISCWIAGSLLSDSVVTDSWFLSLDNQGALPVEVTQARALLLGDETGYAVSAGEVALGTGTLAPGQVSGLALTVSRAELDPDRYRGSFRIALADAEEPLSIPATVLVRSGPLPAFLVLFVGILVGRVARAMRSPEAQLQLELTPRLARLETRLDALEDPVSKRWARRRIEGLHRRLIKADETIEDLRPVVDALESDIDQLIVLDELVGELDGLAERSRRELLAEVEGARELLRQGKRDEAGQRVEGLEKKIAEATAPQADGQLEGGPTARGFSLSGGGVAEGEGAISGEQRGVLTDLVRQVADGLRSRPGDGEDVEPSLSARILTFLSGVETHGPVVRYAVLRPLLWLILLVVLALTGLETLYLNDPVFGSKGIFDYLALFVWGIGSDVARQSLLGFTASGQEK